MKFIGTVAVTNGGTDTDPVADPANVEAANLVGHAGSGPDNNTTTTRMFLSFDGTTGGTTVSVYALDDDTNGPSTAPADRKFYLIQSGIALTARVLTAVTGPVPHKGPYYIRQTGGTTAGNVKVAVQTY